MFKSFSGIVVLCIALSACGTLGAPSIGEFNVTYLASSSAANPCPGGLQATLTADGTTFGSPPVAIGKQYSTSLDLGKIRKGAVFQVQALCLDASGQVLQQNARAVTLQEDFQPRNRTYVVKVDLSKDGATDIRCQDKTKNNAPAPCIFILDF